jgi:membrane dipeptidase
MAADLVLHIEHAINVCGEDHVGLGTDGYITPVAVTPEYKKTFAQEVITRRQLGISAPGEDPNVYLFIPDLNSPDHFNRVAVLLSRRGHSDTQIEKILGGNFERILSEAWKT